MELSQADSAGCLSVSQCLQFWNKYPSKDSVSRRHVLGWPWVRAPAVCPTAHSRPFCNIREKNPHYYSTNFISKMQISMPVVCPPPPLSTDENMTHLCWAREHISWTRQQWTFSLFTDESRFTLERDSEHMLVFCWSGRNNTPNINPQLLKNMDTEVLELWLEQVFFLMVILTCMCSMEKLIGERNWDEILHPYIHSCAGVIGNNCILMDNNVWSHKSVVVEYCLECHNLEQIEWPAHSPDLNLFENIWDYLGR